MTPTADPVYRGLTGSKWMRKCFERRLPFLIYIHIFIVSVPVVTVLMVTVDRCPPEQVDDEFLTDIIPHRGHACKRLQSVDLRSKKLAEQK